jgi:hypothetical protein
MLPSIFHPLEAKPEVNGKPVIASTPITNVQVVTGRFLT